MRKIATRSFYEETPYANVEQDILAVADAIQKHSRGQEIDKMSPAFWGNMMSVIYAKNGK
jgi:hypothetical protein